MDPIEVLRRIWQQRWFAIPALLITLTAAALVFLYGPRDYESTASYAVVSPDLPTNAQVEADPSLGELSATNPFLRSSDPSLVTSVVITQLNSPTTEDRLKSLGLGTDFTVEPSVSGSGFIATITGSGDTPAASLATTAELGTMFTDTLREVQTVNGADERYLYTSIQASAPDRATEKLSSRLRAVIVVGVLGVILIFGAVSLGSALTARRARRQTGSQARPTGNRPLRAGRAARGGRASTR